MDAGVDGGNTQERGSGDHGYVADPDTRGGGLDDTGPSPALRRLLLKKVLWDSMCIGVCGMCVVAHAVLLRSCVRVGILKAAVSLETVRMALSVAALVFVAFEASARGGGEAVDPRTRVLTCSSVFGIALTALKHGPDVSSWSDPFVVAVRARFRHTSWDLLIIQVVTSVIILAWAADVVAVGVYPARLLRKWLLVADVAYWIVFVAGACLQRSDSVLSVAIVGVTCTLYGFSFLSALSGNDPTLVFVPDHALVPRRGTEVLDTIPAGRGSRAYYRSG